jgi:hypothetical protein
VRRAGSIGGADFHPNSRRLGILASDYCFVATFRTGQPIPGSLSTEFATEPTLDLTCTTELGVARFGFVSDALSPDDNTVPNAVPTRSLKQSRQLLARAFESLVFQQNEDLNLLEVVLPSIQVFSCQHWLVSQELYKKMASPQVFQIDFRQC